MIRIKVVHRAEDADLGSLAGSRTSKLRVWRLRALCVTKRNSYLCTLCAREVQDMLSLFKRKLPGRINHST